SLAIARPGRLSLGVLSGQKDLGVQHVTTVREIVHPAAALIAQSFAGAVGRGSDGAPPGAARDAADLHKEVRHGSRLPRHAHAQPLARAGRLQVAAEIGELLDLRREHRRLEHVLLAHRERAARDPEARALARAGSLTADHLALADEPRGELRRSALFARRA